MIEFQRILGHEELVQTGEAEFVSLLFSEVVGSMISHDLAQQVSRCWQVELYGATTAMFTWFDAMWNTSGSFPSAHPNEEETS